MQSHKAALYARVSTNGHGQDPEVQLRELRDYCQRRDWFVADEYVDRGVSGSKEKRAELDRLMRDARRRSFDSVVVWKLDRFGRSLKHLVNALAEFEALGITFVSLKDGFDLSTPSGWLMMQIVGSMAEFERSLIQERVRAGLRNARAKGKRLGRPRAFLDADQIIELRRQGLSWETVGRRLGVAKGTVISRAKNLRAPTLVTA